MARVPEAGKRIVIVASASDETAQGLAVRLARPEIVVVTPSDLSEPGWCYRPGKDASSIVAQGQMLRSEDITAVITRLPWVAEAELPHIIDQDRAYVAAEMGAFLVAWLSEVGCPTANRPGPQCLCGPFWRHERWVAEAARLGLAVEPARRVVGLDAAANVAANYDSRVTVTVIGELCFGEADDALRQQALLLARATAVETLTVHFADSGSGLRFFSANPWPILEDDELATALLDHVEEASGAAR